MHGRTFFLTLVLGVVGATPMGWAQDAAHFHHVHLNVTDPAKTIQFYGRMLGAVEVNYRGASPALFTERSFILMTKVDAEPPSGPKTALSHIGWAGKDGPNEFEWFKKQGVEFQTPVGQLGNNYGMYMFGPSRELVEVWTGGQNHRFDHIHLWATDVQQMSDWFKNVLGLAPRVLPKPTIQDKDNIGAIWMSFTQCDNVGIVVFGRPTFESVWWPGSNYKAADGPGERFEATKGRAIDHIAFSFRDLDAAHEKMKAAGANIVEPISAKAEYGGMRSFFVLAPDDLLVEIVQEKPVPDGIWEE